MIAVVADDLSGAAELAGAAYERGLRAAVLTGLTGDIATIDVPDCDVLAVDADTRSLSADNAGARTAAVVRALLPHRPAWIYKKCDSVLRGQVLAEVRAAATAAGMRRVMLVPANPRRGRVIRDGRYYVGDRPVDQTPFAADPEYPRRSADVRQMLGDDGGGGDVISLARATPVPNAGVILPDADSSDALRAMANEVDDSTLPGGAVEFFEALLDRHAAGSAKQRPTAQPSHGSSNGSTLMICGSAAGWRAGRASQCEANRVPVVAMPADEARWAADRQAVVTEWSRGVADALSSADAACIAIGRADAVAGVSAVDLAARLADAAAAAVAMARPARLAVEGGGTAAAVLRALGWRQLLVRRVWLTGVVELDPNPGDLVAWASTLARVCGPAEIHGQGYLPMPQEISATDPNVAAVRRVTVVVKVGSYDWPAQVWPPSHPGRNP